MVSRLAEMQKKSYRIKLMIAGMNSYLSSSLNSVVSLDLETSWAAKSLQEAIKRSQFEARFQQKQMQEKEEKLLSLYKSHQQRAFECAARGSAGSNVSTALNVSTGGKVRQMFDERRQKAGIDRSYPLEPLKMFKASEQHNTSRLKNNSITTVSNKTTAVKTIAQKSVTLVKNGNSLVNKKQTIKDMYHNSENNDEKNVEQHFYEKENTFVNGEDDLLQLMNKNSITDSNLDNEELPDFDVDVSEDRPLVECKKKNINHQLPSQTTADKKIIKTNYASITLSERTKPVSSKNKPIIKRTVTKGYTRPPDRISSPLQQQNRESASNNSMQSNRPQAPRPSAQQQSRKQATMPSQVRAPSASRPSARQSGKSAVTRDDLETCKYCNRRFAGDRLQVHEDICARTAKKRRKAYDATKHRLQGTELEPYVRKSVRSAGGKAAKQIQSKQTEWRRKHEEFIAAIRAAKMAQVHVAKGGKLSDLPPPPPSSNPDYVQCPHCGRRFNETAAARHIPKCATYDFNKSKPKQVGSGGSKMSSAASSGAKIPSGKGSTFR